jgi:hypothetical protein
MSRKTFALAGIACLFGTLAGNDCVAKTATPKNYVNEETRNIAGGRKVLVVLARALSISCARSRRPSTSMSLATLRQHLGAYSE